MTKFDSISSNRNNSKHKVLIITGGLLTEKETSIFHAVKKQYKQTKYSQHAWLEVKLKTLTLEPLLAVTFEKIYDFFTRQTSSRVRYLLNSKENVNTPELAEVVLSTLLRQQKIPFETTTISSLFDNKTLTEKLLSKCDCVFLSTTLLRDLSELEPIIAMINRPDNHIVLGGALTSLIHGQWPGLEGVEILTVGYGEWLIPILADWIRSDFTELTPKSPGYRERKNSTDILFSGFPETSSLDSLPRPDWSYTQKYHNTSYKMINYESVRGCPYNCSFCNYPYLFDDTKFRYLSANRIADDWFHYANNLDVKYITCLDSLFTMPRRRLLDLCQLLINRNIKIKWICYARADDLADENIVKLMKRAGAHQVQIGLESGHPDILENMDKRCSVNLNAKAIANCRKHNLTTVVSLIVGFPGETHETLAATYNFLCTNQPDFYYLATFSVRAEKVPILNLINRNKFGIYVEKNAYTMAPYWKHNSMDCVQASDHVRTLNQRLMKNKISLNAVIFYSGLLHYDSVDRQELLAFQKKIITRHPFLRYIFNLLNKGVNYKMRKDMRYCFRHRQPINVKINTQIDNT